MLPKIGVPPNHPFLIGFSLINHPFWVVFTFSIPEKKGSTLCHVFVSEIFQGWRRSFMEMFLPLPSLTANAPANGWLDQHLQRGC